MRARSRRGIAALPLALVLAAASAPLVFLVARIPDAGLVIDWSSFGPTLRFAIGGAVVATTTGGAIGMLSSMREYPGRRILLVLSIVPLAAPPAFWWIGATRLSSAWGNAKGPGAAAV